MFLNNILLVINYIVIFNYHFLLSFSIIPLKVGRKVQRGEFTCPRSLSKVTESKFEPSSKCFQPLARNHCITLVKAEDSIWGTRREQC